MYGWEADRVEAIIRAHIRLSIHPAAWKTARGATIPKPGKGDSSLAKAYRAISLLNCLGKMVGKVAADLISIHCGALDPRALERRGQTLRVETPDRMALLFDDERATKAVLTFLRKTKIGQMVTIPPRDVGLGGGKRRGERSRKGRGKGGW